MRDLISGSTDAREQLGDLSSSAQSVVNDIVDTAFVRGQRAVMILGVVVCVIGVWTALWGRSTAEHEGRIHRLAHGFSAAHWRPEAQPTA